MAVVILNSDFISPTATPVVLASGDFAVVTLGTVIGYNGTAGLAAIQSEFAGARVSVQGEVYGGQGILINGSSGAVSVGSSGQVAGQTIGINLANSFGTVRNAGYVAGAAYGISLGVSGTVANLGVVNGDGMGVRVFGAAVISNDGLLAGGLGIGLTGSTTGAISVTNTGTISGSTGIAIRLSDGADTVINGGIISGAVILGGGNDEYDGREGRVLGRIELGFGDDVARGGEGSERFVSSAGDGNDTISGGIGFGTDTYDASGNQSTNLTLNLATGIARYGNSGVIDILDGIERVIGGSQRNILRGGDGSETLVGGVANDDLTGQGGRDHLVGNAGLDRLSGGDGFDLLLGGAGSDSLYGGEGDDVLSAGAGADTMYGGAGGDEFVFTEVERAGRGFLIDRISDFALGIDEIDLSGIDAHDGIAGNQAFNFVGTGGVTAVGQLGYSVSGGITRIWGMVESGIVLQRVTFLELTGVFVLASDDFIL